jgi:hypothetical protein
MSNDASEEAVEEFENPPDPERQGIVREIKLNHQSVSDEKLLYRAAERVNHWRRSSDNNNRSLLPIPMVMWLRARRLSEILGQNVTEGELTRLLEGS